VAHDDEAEILAARPHLIADVVDEDIVPEVRFAQHLFEILRVPRTRLRILAEFVGMSLGETYTHIHTHTFHPYTHTRTLSETCEEYDAERGSTGGAARWSTS
jgi:hypothetical protein